MRRRAGRCSHLSAERRERPLARKVARLLSEGVDPEEIARQLAQPVETVQRAIGHLKLSPRRRVIATTERPPWAPGSLPDAPVVRRILGHLEGLYGNLGASSASRALDADGREAAAVQWLLAAWSADPGSFSRHGRTIVLDGIIPWERLFAGIANLDYYDAAGLAHRGLCMGDGACGCIVRVEGGWWHAYDIEGRPLDLRRWPRVLPWRRRTLHPAALSYDEALAAMRDDPALRGRLVSHLQSGDWSHVSLERAGDELRAIVSLRRADLPGPSKTPPFAPCGPNAACIPTAPRPRWNRTRGSRRDSM